MKNHQYRTTLVGLIGWYSLLAIILWQGFSIEWQSERTALIAAIWQHVAYAVLAMPLILLGSFKLRKYIPLVSTYRQWWYLNGVLLGAVWLSGWMTVWSRGNDIKVFKLLVIPTPFAERSVWYERFEALHGWLVYGLLIALAVFICVVIKHLFVQRRPLGRSQ